MIREATATERGTLFPRSEASGGFVYELDGAVCGYVGFIVSEETFYAHDLFAFWGGKRVAAYLIQRVRREARRLGFESVDFHVELAYPTLLRLVHSGKAEVTGFSMRARS